MLDIIFYVNKHFEVAHISNIKKKHTKNKNSRIAQVKWLVNL